jgi:hypothetical protein
MSFMLLGILNSQAAGGGGGAFDLLESTTLTSSASSVTFSGLDTLAAGYKHLQVRAVLKPGGNAYFRIRFNNDTANNFTFHYLSGDGGAMESGWEGTTRSYIDIDQTSTTNFTPAVIDILDFASTNKNTTTRSLSGGLTTSASKIRLSSGVYLSTNAVTEINLLSTNAAQAGSRFSLYGVK